MKNTYAKSLEEVTSSIHKMEVKLGASFIIRIENQVGDPGASWVHQFDKKQLEMISSGWQPQGDGSSFTWIKFKAKKTGKTLIEAVWQPQLINPLFTSIIYEIRIKP